jgi:Fe-S-cluster containining protein
MNSQCAKCGGKCCQYFCFEIDEPDDVDEFEDVRWYLCHEGVSVHIDEGDWYICIENRCRFLGPDARCDMYDERPLICRKYDPGNCDYTQGSYDYDEEFRTPEELERYARKVLGDEVFQRKRRRARKRLDGKMDRKAGRKRGRSAPARSKGAAAASRQRGGRRKKTSKRRGGSGGRQT